MSDAHAFLRTILKQPDDPVAPLVFADWLDESGERDKLIWAGYVRTRAACDRLDPSDPERDALRDCAAHLARRLRYRIRLHVSHFLPHADVLLRLLPPLQWTLDLGGFNPPPTILEIVPVSVAYVDLMLPLRLQGERLYVAMTDPSDPDMIDKLTFILTKEIVAFQASADQLREAIDRHHGQFGGEGVVR